MAKNKIEKTQESEITLKDVFLDIPKLNQEFQGQVISANLGEKITHILKRPNGTTIVADDYSACPSRTDQSQAQSTDLNYLVERFRTDELTAYIAARSQHKQEIVGHDFSQEPNLQTAKNEVLRLKQSFEELPEQIRKEFVTVQNFINFVDNKDNAQKLIDMKLITLKQIESVLPPTPTPLSNNLPTPTPES